MRLLQVLHNYPPEFRGGVERYVEGLAAGLLAGGHEVLVLAGSETRARRAEIREEELAGVPVRRLVRGPGLCNPVDPFEPELVRLYETVLAEISPDVVHVHHWWNLGDDLVRRAAARGLPVVLTLHDFFATCSLFFRLPDNVHPCDRAQEPEACAPCVGERFGIDGREVSFGVGLRRRAFVAEAHAARAVLAPSASHARALEEFLGAGVLVSPLPLGSEDVEPVIPVGPGPPAGPLRVLHFGNLSRLKGVEFLAQAVEAADPAGDRIRLVLSGGGLESGLETGRAVRTGPYDTAGLRVLASEADVAVFPSLARESYGVVVDEALRLGLPVVVSDRGALPERIGSRGLVVPAGDVAALAGVLRGLLDGPQNLRDLRSGSPGTLLTRKEHARRLAELYATCLGGASPVVDLERPLLERIAHGRGRITEILGFLARQARGGGPT
jgi:glycosyltransferase involved in cell wall biosynthesis